MTSKRINLLLVVVVLTAAMAFGQPAVEPRADQILRSMGEYLAAADEFTFRAEITYDAFLDIGQEVQYGGRVSVTVRRPDALRVEYDGDERQHRVLLQGGTFVMHDLETNLYAMEEVPAEIDAAIDRIFDLFGFSVPIADLVYSDPYAILIESVDAGVVLGRSTVDGIPCHHLAFSQATLDWQIWIEDGPHPLPRKLVITDKAVSGAPQYVARITNWDLEPSLSDHYFEFTPPAGSDEVEFLRAPEEEEDVEP